MRYNEFASTLVEAAAPKAAVQKPKNPATLPQVMDKATAQAALAQMGYENTTLNGNIVRVLVQIPSGQQSGTYRTSIINDILARFQKMYPKAGPKYQGNTSALGSKGGVVFANSPVGITVKDEGVQGDKSSGVGNEAELAGLLASMVKKYKTINVSFVDPRGKSLSMNGVTTVTQTGKDVAARRKADVVLSSKTGNLPISIKQLNAETWESADRFFGAKARQIIDQLVKQKVLKLIPLENPPGAYALSKEVVIEPTEEEAMSAIFGSDISPEGGIVIQTFEPKHFVQDKNNIQIECHAVIKEKGDIPESHMMVWLLRNNASRLSKTLGIRGIRPMASVLTRAIGTKGTKDVILVDKDGTVIRS
jgi:hypothetical protein